MLLKQENCANALAKEDEPEKHCKAVIIALQQALAILTLKKYPAGLYRAYSDNRELTLQDLKEALGETYPLSKVMGEVITQLRKWAKVRAKLASRTFQ